MKTAKINKTYIRKDKTMKKAVSLILSAVLLFSCLSFSASAQSTAAAEKTESGYNLDWFKCACKWLYLCLNPVPVNESGVKVKVSKEKISKQMKSAPEAHASTILKMKNGNLICAWFAGANEGADDVRIFYSVCKDGKWTSPKQIITNIDAAHWNPVLYETKDGNVRLYFKAGGCSQDWLGYYCESEDFGESFGEIHEIPLNTNVGLTASGPVKNQCFRTKEGLLLAPNSYETNSIRHSVIEYSEDDGLTWKNNGEITGTDKDGNDAKIIQPAIWQSDDGSCHALMRSKSSFTYRTDSSDGGKTWSKAYRISLPNNNSGLDLVKTDDGLIWLLCNPSPIDWFRAPLTLYVSKDDGNTWKTVTNIHIGIFEELSYPFVVAEGNTLYISYTNNRKNINYAKVEYTY